jgi:16S rRNA (cytidine1402-2'-O)-methyltransferase
MPGRLSVVATPIGCLEDITLRALRVLGEADLILAEDTRHTRILCKRHGIGTPLQSFHAHTRDDKIDRLVRELFEGAHYALVSDAGTPLVSDPGARLVSRAAESGVTIEAVPGPSAVLAALCVSGLPTDRFAFEGFLPRSGRDRARALQRLVDSDCAIVLFESPHRVRATLEDLGHHLEAERRIALCRELTKVHEQVIRGTVSQVQAELRDPVKGEITLVVQGRHSDDRPEEVDVDELVARWRSEGLTTKQMTQRLMQQFGWKRNAAYQAVVDALGRIEA